MKIFGYITLVALAGAVLLRAQTNTSTNAVDQILALVTTNAPASKPPAPRLPTRIESDSVDFDLAAREATYHGHVYVDDPEIKLHCDWLVADLPQTGHINHIVAETNVVIDATDDKGQKMHATGDKAVYVYNVENGVTNEVVTLTGHAKVENVQGWMTGEPITLDAITKHVHAENMKMVYWQKPDVASTSTNVTAMTTNSPATATNSQATVTNSSAVKTNLLPATTNQATAQK